MVKECGRQERRHDSEECRTERHSYQVKESGERRLEGCPTGSRAAKVEYRT